MFIPNSFREERSEQLHAQLQAQALGLLLTHGAHGLQASPIAFRFKSSAMMGATSVAAQWSSKGRESLLMLGKNIGATRLDFAAPSRRSQGFLVARIARGDRMQMRKRPAANDTLRSPPEALLS
jgi:hypothetical protein